VLQPTALAREDAEANLKAMFIARFAQFTQWPPPPQTVFHYCVALDHNMFEAINALQVRSPAGEPVKLTLIRRPAQAKTCQLLVMTLSDRQQLQHWADGLANMPLLIVADNAEAFRTVATIGLVSEPDGMTFRINQTAARKRGLELSSQLLKLAREVR
jgi:hypothetical protein